MNVIFQSALSDSFWIFVAFLVVVLMAFKARRIILGGAYTRIERIKKEISEAELLREDAHNLLVEYQKKHEEALALINTIAQDAQAEAVVAKETIEKDAENAIARAEHQAHDSIVKAEVEATREIRMKIFNTAIKVVDSIVKEELKTEKASVLIDDAIKEISTLKRPRVYL